jgi:acyl-CoA thioesterase I
MRSNFISTRRASFLKKALSAAFCFLACAQCICTSLSANRNSTLRVLPLGDSITSGDTAHDSYRRPLWKLLDSAGYQVDFIGSTKMNAGGPPPDTDFDRDNEGHYGWRADQIAESLPGWLKLYTPDVVLMHIGTNDIAQGKTVGQTVAEIETIIGEARDSNPKVVILLALIIPNPFGVDSLNAALPVLADSLSTGLSPVNIVDQNFGFDPIVDSYDGAHPNADGERKMAGKWYGALEPFLK